MNTQGTIFEIQHLSSFDGPGVRTVVYLKGCPLHCIWCHNPEGISGHPQIFYNPGRCTDCGECIKKCPYNCHQKQGQQHVFFRKDCISCGKCTSGCLSHALVYSGKLVTVQDILEELSVDFPFFQGNGGLTLSGGEPLIQPEFTRSLLLHAKEQGIHTCIETSGFCQKETLKKIAPLTDLFLFDIKETDTLLHKKFTGVSNEKILENLSYLNTIHHHIVLRCPMIPGKNFRKEHQKGIALLAEQLSAVEAIELEPYHPLGLSKYQKLGMCPGYNNVNYPEPESLMQAIMWMQSFTKKRFD